MAILFLANLKPQIFSFTFRIPGNGKGATWKLDVKPYAQKMVYKDTSVDLLKGLLDQIHHYGFQTYEEALVNSRFDGYAFSFGKPFSDDEILALKSQYFRCTQEVGTKRRTKSLLDTGNQLLNEAVRFNIAGLEDLSSDPNHFGLKILQQDNSYDRGILNEQYGLRGT